MNYVFQIRNWNVSFFEELEKIIKICEPEATIVRLTMQKEASRILQNHNKSVTYLPELFIHKSEFFNDEEDRQLDIFMHTNFGYGVEFIYELERFKPKSTEKEKFVKGHIKALMELIPNDAKMISLTCDHFVFIISAYINIFKGGSNFFIQPIGFPINAQVILETPWNLNFFKPKINDFEPLEQYIQSLTKIPQETIHYMKPQRTVTLWQSIIKRLNETLRYNRDESIFTYLDNSPKNILPDRLKRKKRINHNIKYIKESTLKALVKESNVFYYPLQFEPEMSILVYSPWYNNQLDIIRLVCQSLRKGDILLLKENPKMVGVRHKSFYQSIDTYCSVRWADPSLNSREIIRHSFKVISITGTASIEAACLGIDSIVFGYPPFRRLLIEEPVSNQNISNLSSILYRKHTSEELIDYVKLKWPEFYRSIFHGNLIPHYIKNKFTIAEAKSISKQFAEQVLLRS